MGKPAKRRSTAVGCAAIALVLAVPLSVVLIGTTMVEAALEARRWFSLGDTSLAVWIVGLSLGFVGAAFAAVLSRFGRRPGAGGERPARRLLAKVVRHLPAAIVLLLVAAVVLLAFGPDPVPVKDAQDVSFVEGVVEVDADVAYARLAQDLETELRRLPKFKGADVSALSGRMPVSNRSIDLKRYGTLPPQVIGEDLYVRMTSMGWESEYFARGERLLFRTDFIIHVEALGRSRARIDVIETHPQATVGTKFLPIGRHMVPEVRHVRVDVAPTAVDRREVLGLANAIANGGVCRTEMDISVPVCHPGATP
jgi:hypothetical protein